MNSSTKQNTTVRRWVLKLALILFDIFAVNFSYYMALILRFYVNGTFHMAGTLFMPLFLRFAPWYSVCCIAVFWLFKLYNGMWRYAGFSDINRVIMANVVTFVIQVVGSMFFTGGLPVTRMPLSYYGIGAVIQFALIFLSRFSYRLLTVELKKISNDNDPNSVRAAIVGAGETARVLMRQLEGDNVLHPVCVIDLRSSETGRLFNGLPVLDGTDGLREAVEKYGVKDVIIADPVLSEESRKGVHKSCRELGIEAQEFTVNVGSSGKLSLRKMMECASGPVELILDGKSRSFESGEDALLATQGSYTVRSVRARDGKLSLELVVDDSDSVNEEWIQDYERETGETVSFF